MGWKNEFLRLYTSGNLDDFSQALKLKRENLPKRLFRFRSLKDIHYRIDEIVNGTIWMAHPSTTNDPFDACSLLKKDDPSIYFHSEVKTTFMKQFENIIPEDRYNTIFGSENWYENIMDYVVEVTSKEEKCEEHKQVLKNVMQQEFEILNEYLNDMNRKMCRFACFTETNLNLPMWAHYADNHEGICLEYDIEALKSVYIKNRFFPIFYTDKLPDGILSLQHDEGLGPIMLDSLLIHKLNDWSYEREWRLVFTAGSWYFGPEEVPKSFWDNGKNLNFIRPSKIYLGYKITNENESIIKDIAKRCEIPVERMSITPYGLLAENCKLS